MTAIIALMNKKGAALAADSAVTRPRRGISKVTNNGNKMVRISDDLPVCVMISGNSNFLTTPWDVIARRYRQERKGNLLATVEDYALDFFHYMHLNKHIWDKDYEKEILKEPLYSIVEDLARTARICPNDKLEEEIREVLEDNIYQYDSQEVVSQMVDYSPDEFYRSFDSFLNNSIDELSHKDDDIARVLNLSDVRKLLLRFLYSKVRVSFDSPYSTLLIFAGMGACQQFPSVITAVVNGGYSTRVVYKFERKRSVTINESQPSAILYFAQDDIIRATLRGADDNWIRRMKEMFVASFNPMTYKDHAMAHRLDMELVEEINNKCEDSVKKWEKALETLDLIPMAELAETLISLTSLHRKLTFSHEGVGGEIDLAVLTKEDGFRWLNRKSWYHHKDIGGKYGNLGV